MRGQVSYIILASIIYYFGKYHILLCQVGHVIWTAAIVRIVLMRYLNLEKFLNQPDADLNIMLANASELSPYELEFS